MALDDLLHRRPRKVELAPVTALVTASSEAGIFVTPIGQSADHPIGPCRGVRTRLTPTLATVPLPVGVHVLVVFTTTGPWIIAVDE